MPPLPDKEGQDMRTVGRKETPPEPKPKPKEEKKAQTTVTAGK